MDSQCESCALRILQQRPAVPEAPTPEEAAEAREVAVSTLWNVVRNGSEARARNDAWRILKELGEVK